MIKTLMTAMTVGLIATGASAGVTRDGNTITIVGEISSYTATQWSKLFDSDVNLVKMTSPGGRVDAGMEIAEDIYANRDSIATEAEGQCASMCAAMWLAADDHVYNFNADIGFHLSYIPDANAYKDYQYEYGLRGVEEYIKSTALKDMAMYARFIDNKDEIFNFLIGLNAFGTMNVDMWYPSEYELVAMEGAWVERPQPRSYNIAEPITK